MSCFIASQSFDVGISWTVMLHCGFKYAFLSKFVHVPFLRGKMLEPCTFWLVWQRCRLSMPVMIGVLFTPSHDTLKFYFCVCCNLGKLFIYNVRMPAFVRTKFPCTKLTFLSFTTCASLFLINVTRHIVPIVLLEHYQCLEGIYLCSKFSSRTHLLPASLM